MADTHFTPLMPVAANQGAGKQVTLRPFERSIDAGH
jgi:hypothetical protein